MPKEFWAETVSCAVYLSNHSPTKNVKSLKQAPRVWNRGIDKYFQAHCQYEYARYVKKFDNGDILLV